MDGSIRGSQAAPPRRLYHTALSAVARDGTDHVLRCVALPPSSTCAEPSNAPDVSAAGSSRRSVRGVPAKRTGILQRPLVDVPQPQRRRAASKQEGGATTTSPDAMAFLSTLTTAKLTDAQAEALAYPYHAHPYSWDDVSDALSQRLVQTAAAVSWNCPRHRAGWDKDLRFYGEWWLSFRDLASAAAQRTRVGMGAVDLRASAAQVKPKRGEVNRPLLPPEERTAWAEDQLVADLALRLRSGKLFLLDALHIDCLAMTPDRMHVLLCDGVLAAMSRDTTSIVGPTSGLEGSRPSSRGNTSLFTSNDSGLCSAALPAVCAVASSTANASCTSDEGSHRAGPSSCIGAASAAAESSHVSMSHAKSEIGAQPRGGAAAPFVLETLSFSMCQVGSSSLMVLLGSLSAIEDERTRTLAAGNATGDRPPSSIVNLDLSYNTIGEHSFYAMTMLLPRTGLRRLSLRGNDLRGVDTASARDFFLEGCQFLEELDIGYTNLSVPQLCVLLDALPRLKRLRVLSLDYLELSAERAAMLSRAVSQSKLWSVSLRGCAVCAQDTFQQFISAACERNRRHAVGPQRKSLSSPEDEVPLFFEHFFAKSLANGWVPPEMHALPDGYGPFTDNDPSLRQPPNRAHTEISTK